MWVALDAALPSRCVEIIPFALATAVVEKREVTLGGFLKVCNFQNYMSCEGCDIIKAKGKVQNVWQNFATSIQECGR